MCFCIYIYIYIYIYILCTLLLFIKVVMYIQKLQPLCIGSPLMMAQNRTESTWEINNYGKYINQLLPNTMRSIRQYERINKKICRQKMCIIFNEICINEEMLPKYTYIYIYIYIYIVPNVLVLIKIKAYGFLRLEARIFLITQDCRIHRLYFYRELRSTPLRSVLNIALNFIWWWGSSPRAFRYVEYILWQ